MLLGYGLIIRVFRENPFASRTVEVTDEKRVISSGPYAIVRHPMYAGASLLLIFTPLALGSWVALPLSLVLLLVVAVRAREEEKYLAANLGGYRPMYGVLIDMVGDQTPRFPVEGNSREYAPEIVQRVWSLAHQLGYAEMFPMATAGAISDDHIPLNQAGIKTIDIIDFDYGPGNAYWHTTQDVVQNTGTAGLRAVGTLLANLVYRGG